MEGKLEGKTGWQYGNVAKSGNSPDTKSTADDDRCLRPAATQTPGSVGERLLRRDPKQQIIQRSAGPLDLFGFPGGGLTAENRRYVPVSRVESIESYEDSREPLIRSVVTLVGGKAFYSSATAEELARMYQTHLSGVASVPSYDWADAYNGKVPVW